MTTVAFMIAILTAHRIHGEHPFCDRLRTGLIEIAVEEANASKPGDKIHLDQDRDSIRKFITRCERKTKHKHGSSK